MNRTAEAAAADAGLDGSPAAVPKIDDMMLPRMLILLPHAIVPDCLPELAKRRLNIGENPISGCGLAAGLPGVLVHAEITLTNVNVLDFHALLRDYHLPSGQSGPGG